MRNLLCKLLETHLLLFKLSMMMRADLQILSNILHKQRNSQSRNQMNRLDQLMRTCKFTIKIMALATAKASSQARRRMINLLMTAASMLREMSTLTLLILIRIGTNSNSMDLVTLATKIKNRMMAKRRKTKIKRYEPLIREFTSTPAIDALICYSFHFLILIMSLY